MRQCQAAIAVLPHGRSIDPGVCSCSERGYSTTASSYRGGYTMSHQEPLLTSREQYRSELQRFPLMSREEQHIVEAAAKAGDEQAKERLMYQVMRYANYLAFRYSSTYLTEDDYLDLVQIANLTIIEKFDKGLATREPIGYLCVTARYAIINYSMYHSRLINVPKQDGEPREAAPQIVSINALDKDTIESLLEETNLTTDEEQAAADTLFGPLKEAFEALNPNYQETINRHLGINGHAAERFVDIDREYGQYHVARSRYVKALARLQKLLKRA